MTIDRNQQSLADLIEQTSSYQLPNISKTNAITSSFDNDLLKATEGQIEESIRAEKEEATLYSAQLNDVYEAKKKRAQALRVLIPTGIAGAYFFPGQITYPTSISPQVFFIGIPIFLLYANLLLALINPFFPTNKIINPPKEQDN